MRYNNLDKFLSSVKAGKLCKGCVITFTDPTVTEISAEAGFDFCWIDGEHGVMDRQTAMLHIMALKGTDCAPFFRVPACDHTEIKKIIDFAPAGIIIPMVLTKADAEYAVSACRYPLTGTRGCGFRRGNAYGTIPMDEYYAASEKDPLVIIQIEHIEAFRNLDEILSVPGIDAILVGPYDLTISMGKAGQWDDPEVGQVIDTICEKTLKAGKILGAYAECQFERWRKRGVNFLAGANDTGALFNGYRQLLKQLDL
ncbi:MAG: 4-hydroxy-3-methylbut-2-en-1-yl diphosphate synthase [Lentisphaeria bacterium]|nr:4-hydroxy-3-methylbut-2-en-1-yl diphosphate synthase [Lentisphaeria bacterium]